MDGQVFRAGVPLDDLPAGLVSRLSIVPADLYLRNSGHLVLYAPARSDVSMLGRPDLRGRLWIAAGDVPAVRSMLPGALARALAERPDDPVAAHREAHHMLIETVAPAFGQDADPEAADIGLVEAALDVIVDRHRDDPAARDAALAVLRRRRNWVNDALNTCILSLVLAHEIGMDREALRVIARGAFFHDLGFLQLPPALAENPEPIDPKQLALARRHPSIGVTMLVDALAATPVYAPIVRGHHERIDGSGYPSRLAGPAIGVGTQIVGIADTWGALTVRQPHRAPADFEAAEQRLLLPTSGFDPRLTSQFISLVARH